ncbi:transglutaminase domain-containing protein [bacterium]|nr:transglutaminase domain-containing protein [bacterium]
MGLAGWMAAGCTAMAPAKQATASRQFAIRYVAKVADVPKGARELRLWLPCPASNVHQTIADLAVKSPCGYKVTTDPTFGNRIIAVHAKNPPATLEVEVSYTVTRHVNAPDAVADTDRARLAWASKPNELVPVSDETRRLAATAVGRAATPVAKARALYDHTLAHMTYDKTGTGWGRGSFRHACDFGRGNCTDFHAYFIALCRSVGIPAYFEIGFTAPERPAEGAIAGYHCWAYFWDGGRWVPVDISEADRISAKTAFFFGHHDAHRVALSVGRDIVLDPKQAGPPLNYFVEPYAEVDGKPHHGLSRTTHYKTLDGSAK